MSRIIHGDCMEALDFLKPVTMIFADPPDSIGLKYDEYQDNMPLSDYYRWLELVILKSLPKCQIFWLSYFWKHDLSIKHIVHQILKHRHPSWNAKSFIWTYTFGQYRDTDCASSFRPILRLMSHSAILYPDSIRIESERMKIGDSRAAGPKVPSDAWEFVPEDDFRIIPVSNQFALVSTEDYEYLSQYSWHLTSTGHAADGGGKYMHCVIMERMNLIGPTIDHRNQDILDNRRSNLRVATRSQNLANRGAQSNNTSGYKGVTWCQQTQKWRAQIRINKETCAIGRFDNIEDARDAYQRAAIRAFGEFANFQTFEVPRVVGNSPERRNYHPTQHPEALMERIIKFTTKEGDSIIDLFNGTGTTLRVGKRLGREVTGIEMSSEYSLKAAEENNVPIIKIGDLM